MCGIAGFIALKNINVDKIDAIYKMVNKIRHRGPDDQGIESIPFDDSQEVLLGFARLSIRDISMNGHQPMFNEDGDICIAFNGEIYNSDIIREELEYGGVRFAGRSDTEVILKYYEKFGIEKTLQVLNGMFAIVLVDRRNKEVYFVRDRVGEKPLYYWKEGNELIFASEYKAFYMYPSFHPHLNTNVLDEFLLMNGLQERKLSSKESNLCCQDII